ncbi:MAG: alpha-N-arabinofuranosidase, partial [Geminicoccaceae bacterium]
TLFALNRSLDEELPLEVSARGFSGLAVEDALEMHDSDLEAVNTLRDPTRIAPAPLERVALEGDLLRATLAPASWNVIRLMPAA